MASDAVPAMRIPITSRDDWLRLRQQDVTASDIAALFGKSPYKTMLGLFAEKSGLVPSGGEENDAMRRGRYLEPAILAACDEHDLLRDRSLTRATDYWRHPSLRMGATPDAFVYEVGGNRIEPVDAKSVASYVFDAQWSDGVPLHIQLQVLAQAMLMDAPRGWVACGVMTAEFPVHVFEVPRHEKAEHMILDAVGAFWRAVEAGEAPDPCAGDHGTLAAIFPRVDRPEPLDWGDDDEALELLEERARLKEEINPKDGRIKEIDALLKARIGAHALALAPGWKVTWTERKAYTTSVAASRVLRVTTLNLEQEEAA